VERWLGIPVGHRCRDWKRPELGWHNPPAAERVGWPLRGSGCGCAAARLEQGFESPYPLGKIQKAPKETV
jgi:hypothetical protein